MGVTDRVGSGGRGAGGGGWAGGGMGGGGVHVPIAHTHVDEKGKKEER